MLTIEAYLLWLLCISSLFLSTSSLSSLLHNCLKLPLLTKLLKICSENSATSSWPHQIFKIVCFLILITKNRNNFAIVFWVVCWTNHMTLILPTKLIQSGSDVMKGVNPIRSCVSCLDVEFVKFSFVGIPRQFGFSNTSSVDNGREDFVGFVRMIIFEKRNAFQLMWSDVRIKIRIYFFKELFPVIVFSLK